MPKVSAEVLAVVQNAFEQYAEELQNAGYKESARKTKHHEAKKFVRWLNDDFDPKKTTKVG